VDIAAVARGCGVENVTTVRTVDEFVAAVNLPGFFTLNEASGLEFPRTHFLVLRRERLIELRSKYGIGCEKVTRTPRRVATALARIGLGDSDL